MADCEGLLLTGKTAKWLLNQLGVSWAEQELFKEPSNPWSRLTPHLYILYCYTPAVVRVLNQLSVYVPSPPPDGEGGAWLGFHYSPGVEHGWDLSLAPGVGHGWDFRISAPHLEWGMAGISAPHLEWSMTGISAPHLEWSMAGISAPYLEWGMAGISAPHLEWSMAGISTTHLEWSMAGISAPVLFSGESFPLTPPYGSE